MASTQRIKYFNVLLCSSIGFQIMAVLNIPFLFCLAYFNMILVHCYITRQLLAFLLYSCK